MLRGARGRTALAPVERPTSNFRPGTNGPRWSGKALIFPLFSGKTPSGVTNVTSHRLGKGIQFAAYERPRLGRIRFGAARVLMATGNPDASKLQRCFGVGGSRVRPAPCIKGETGCI